MSKLQEPGVDLQSSKNPYHLRILPAMEFAERIKQLKFSTTVKLVDMISCFDHPRA
jgi:hypothetical protein